jgi:hypothetical protein
MGGWDQNGYWEDWMGCVEWIQVAQYRDRWRDIVSAVMNIPVLRRRTYFYSQLAEIPGVARDSR